MKITKCTIAGNICAGNGRTDPEPIAGRGIELDSYCEGNTVTGNAVSQNTDYGIWELPKEGEPTHYNDYNAIVANACTQNSYEDQYQVKKIGEHSFEEDNIKKYQLW